MFGVCVALVTGCGCLEQAVKEEDGFVALHVLKDGGADLAELFVQQTAQALDPVDCVLSVSLLSKVSRAGLTHLLGSLELAKIMSWLTMSAVKGAGSLPA